jgi:hypothetical protein
MSVMTYSQWLASVCIWREARGCTIEAQEAVWRVINNRTVDPQRRWPRTISGVILQHAQFSSFLQSDINVTRFPIEPTPDQSAGTDWLAFERICDEVVGVPLEGTDISGGANSYESLPLDAPKPEWATPEALTVEIGGIRFYRV